MTDKSNPLDPENDQPLQNQEIEDFFQRLPANFRWPKPNAEAVAAAVEAIQRMSGGSEIAHELESSTNPATMCPGCGGSLPAGARFCVWCGQAKDPAANSGTAPPPSPGGQHHFHHHYHHLIPGNSTPASPPSSDAQQQSVVRGKAPGAAPVAPGSRAEVAARQVVQDWAQACNTRHIDDLLELYVADATMIRSGVPPVRSLPAIRELLASMLEAGLGDVEMESLRLEVMGDVALDLGRCKMLVPVAMGKRREERGKYLVVLVRQPAGTWKILADTWSIDAPLGTTPPADAARSAAAEPAPAVRKPR